MNNKLVLARNTRFEEAIKLLDLNGNGVLPVVNMQNELLGIITDGDIRKAILNNQLELEYIINKNPYKLNVSSTKNQIINKLKELHRRHMPLVDDENKYIKMFTLDEVDFNLKPNWVIIMAGGLGTRLRPLTNEVPKPLLEVGNKPILETIINNFLKYGFRNIILSVNYKSEMIEEYFGDGSRFGVNIKYVYEEQRMGTAGALGLIKEKFTQPVFVMNGDLLTNVNFESMLEYHYYHKAKATMGVRKYDFQVPYGVVNVQGNDILSIEEKPVHKFFVSAGIYILDTDMLDRIPQNTFFDMPTLFEILINNEEKTVSFPIREYWLDIGRMSDYERANDEYNGVFN